MMTMMMMQRLLQNNNNNNNGYADETRLNGIRHHSASPFSKPAAVQAAAGSAVAATDIGSGGEPDGSAGNEQQLHLLQTSQSHRPSTAVVTVQTGTCTTVVAALATADTEMDDRLTSDEDDELNVMDEDPVDLTNNRLQENRNAGTAAASTTATTVVPMVVDTAANEYETNSGGDMPCNKGRLAFSVENILDPNKFTKKLIAPAAILPSWRPRIDFTADSSVAGECCYQFNILWND